MRSEYFTLERGTCQGCPLSPSLFALAIEPLAISLRSSPFFNGVIRDNVEYRLSLYVDDLLLYVTDPASCLPSIQSTLGTFSSFSGYKLNLQKSECYPINAAALQLQQADLPFKITCSGFKCLGINVTRTFSGLLTANFTPLITKTKSNLQRWNILPLSLIGRSNVVKMNIFPKFLYLFQWIPLFLPKHFFDSLDKMISSFIWCARSLRVRKSLLQRCKFHSGLALPNFKFYYWATHIHKIRCWVESPGLSWC